MKPAIRNSLLLLALLGAAALPTLSKAQCNGIFPNNSVCGNVSGSSNLPRPTSPSAFAGNAGGTNGQIQFNSGGAFGGFTTSGDATINTTSGVLTISALAVDATKLAANAVTTSKILDAAVTGVKIATGAAVKASGTGLVGDLVLLSDASINQVNSAGYNSSQIPGLIPTTSTVTFSTPTAVNWTSHGLLAGAPVWFCNSGGALPAALTACQPSTGAASSPNTYLQNPTLYYVIGTSISTNSFAVATSLANSRLGAVVTLATVGTGTHTAFANGTACEGCVGEYIYRTIGLASGVALTSGSAGQVWNSFSLSPGVWSLGGDTGVFGAAATVFTHMHSGVVHGFSTIPTSPYNGSAAMHLTSNNANGWIIANDPRQVAITSTTTINAVVTADFTGGTAVAYGFTWARRIK